ncbi:MAG: hypothetical protein L0221_00190 [Chloroflexi bacterium]|nr:hypothetical protein [Chloroflexota bacterium]
MDPDVLPAQRIETNVRPIVPDDEVDLPRWLRPSVRAERFGLDLPHLRRSAPARTPPPAASPDSQFVDLDALFSSHRAAGLVQGTATRGPNGRRRVIRLPDAGA